MQPPGVKDTTRGNSRRELWTRKLIYPGHTLPTAAAPVLIAVGLALHDRVFAPLPALLAFFAGWLIQFGGVVADNYFNLVREPDDREHPELVAALASGLITLPGLRTTVAACWLGALAIGVYLAYVAGPCVIAIGLASIGAAWIYSAGPCAIGRLGLADPLFFVFFGIVSVAGAYYVQAAPAHGALGWFVPAALPSSAILLGLPVGALITNILIIDDIRDREFDAAKGKRSVAVRFGIAWSRAEFVALLALAYLAPFGFWLELGFSAWALLPLLTLPLAFALARAVCTRERFAELVPMTPRAGGLALAYSALLAAGVAMPAA